MPQSDGNVQKRGYLRELPWLGVGGALQIGFFHPLAMGGEKELKALCFFLFFSVDHFLFWWEKVGRSGEKWHFLPLRAR
jgi:hypothetical protein